LSSQTEGWRQSGGNRAFKTHLNQTLTWTLGKNTEKLFKDDSLNIKAEEALKKKNKNAAIASPVSGGRTGITPI